MPSGNIVLSSVGGDGRRTLAKVASLLSNYTFFSVPINSTYSKIMWRNDLRSLIKNTGCYCKDTVLFFTLSQLRDNSFLLEDLESLYTRGEILDLFSLDERHELNEHVHQYMVEQSGTGVITELTPAALYEIFISICKRKLHVILCYDEGDRHALELFRERPCLIDTSVHFILRVKQQFIRK